MPVITLTMSCNRNAAMPSRQGGWRFEICNGDQPLDMSAHKFVQVNTAPYLEKKNHYGTPMDYAGLGHVAWVLTPDQEPLLGAGNGRDILNEPPMRYLQVFYPALEKRDYHAVASHCSSRGSSWLCNESVTYMWTLKSTSS